MNRIVVYVCFMLLTVNSFAQQKNKGIPPENKKKLEAFKKKYLEGERYINFIKEYIDVLESKNKFRNNPRFAFMRLRYSNPETKKLILDYVSKCPIRQLSEQYIWDLAGEYLLEDVYSNAFEYIHSRIDKFKWGKIDARYSILNKMNHKISSEVGEIAYPQENADGKYEMPKYDEEKFLWIEKIVSKGDIKCAAESKIILRIYKESLLSDYQKVFSMLKYGVDMNLLVKNDTYISSMLCYFADNSTDKVLLNNCLSMVKSFVKEDGTGINYYGVISKLYSQLGNRKEAAIAKNKYDAIEKERRSYFENMFKQLEKKK